MKIPIRARLTAVYCLVFCFSTLLLETGTYFGINAAIFAIVDNDLKSRLQGVEEFLLDHVTRRTLPKLQDELRRHEALQPAHLVLARADGFQMFQGSAMRTWPDRAILSAAKIHFQTVAGATEPVRVLASRSTILGQQYDLLLATSLTVPLHIMVQTRAVLLLSAPGVLLLAAMLGYWIAGRALKPVSELTRAARSIGAVNLSRRVAVPQSGDELQDLAVTLNEMLARIEDSFRQINQFTANASHELRTPLALIRTTAEVALLDNSSRSTPYREALHHILSEAEQNTALLDDLMLLARGDAKAPVLVKSQVSLLESVQQACEQMELLTREKGIRLQAELGATPLPVWGHPETLRRLWLILIDNALKYTPAGGCILVTLREIEPASAAVQVIDSGIGIAPEDLPHIFERFFRADAARAKSNRGTGLGLSIAGWIAEAHDATIQVRSALGQGSNFEVTLKVHAVPEVPLLEPTKESKQLQ